MAILPNMAKTVKSHFFTIFFAFFHILRCPNHGFSGLRVFLTHFWGGMRGAHRFFAHKTTFSKNASPVLKVLPPPTGGGGLIARKKVKLIVQNASGTQGTDTPRVIAPPGVTTTK